MCECFDKASRAALALASLSALFEFLAGVNQPSEGWRKLRHSGGFGGLWVGSGRTSHPFLRFSRSHLPAHFLFNLQTPDSWTAVTACEAPFFDEELKGEAGWRLEPT